MNSYNTYDEYFPWFSAVNIGEKSPAIPCVCLHVYLGVLHITYIMRTGT